MGLFSWLFGDDTNESMSGSSVSEINPANGFPMIDGIGGVDVVGNPYGADSQFNDIGVGIDTTDTGLNDCGSSTMDMFDSDTSSSWDDSFSTGSGFDSW